jgi:hydroxymethylpyrimidine pyrophosphatase-like HAD family hydrolase
MCIDFQKYANRDKCLCKRVLQVNIVHYLSSEEPSIIFNGELIVDTAIDHAERMKSSAIKQVEELCREHNIDLWYHSQSDSWFGLNAC